MNEGGHLLGKDKLAEHGLKIYGWQRGLRELRGTKIRQRRHDQIIVHTMFTNTQTHRGGVSYQTEPKQRETELPSLGKVLCTSTTAWPLHPCIEVLQGQPQSFQDHRGPGHNSCDGQTCRQMLNRIFYKYTTYKNC